MPDHPIPHPGPPPPDPRTARHLRLLEELADIGMNLARRLHPAQPDPAQPSPTRPDAADPALSFARISRAIRQTLALEARLAEDHRTRHTAPDTRSTTAERRHARRRRTEIRRLVECSIHAAPDAEDIDSLLLEMDERLEVDADTDILSRPIADSVVSICGALGIAPDLSQWTDAMLGMPSPPSRNPRYDLLEDPDPPDHHWQTPPDPQPSAACGLPMRQPP